MALSHNFSNCALIWGRTLNGRCSVMIERLNIIIQALEYHFSPSWTHHMNPSNIDLPQQNFPKRIKYIKNNIYQIYWIPKIYFIVFKKTKNHFSFYTKNLQISEIMIEQVLKIWSAKTIFYVTFKSGLAVCFYRQTKMRKLCTNSLCSSKATNILIL